MATAAGLARGPMFVLCPRARRLLSWLRHKHQLEQYFNTALLLPPSLRKCCIFQTYVFFKHPPCHFFSSNFCFIFPFAIFLLCDKYPYILVNFNNMFITRYCSSIVSTNYLIVYKRNFSYNILLFIPIFHHVFICLIFVRFLFISLFIYF